MPNTVFGCMDSDAPAGFALPHNAQAVARFRQELVVAGYSQRTIRTYLFLVGDFVKRLPKPVEEVTHADIISFFADKREKENISTTSLALWHSAFKFFFKSFLKTDVMADVRIMKRSKKQPTVLTKDEIKALFRHTTRGRNRLLVQFLYSAGARVSEAAKLRVADLELDEHLAHVRGGKGNKDRIIILSKKWVTEAKKYLKRKKVPSVFVFSKRTTPDAISTTTIQRIIRRAASNAGIQKHVTPHSLRHSFATHLLEAGENIRKIQELLGHANLNTTQIYTTVQTEELKKVKSPMDAL